MEDYIFKNHEKLVILKVYVNVPEGDKKKCTDLNSWAIFRFRRLFFVRHSTATLHSSNGSVTLLIIITVRSQWGRYDLQKNSMAAFFQPFYEDSMLY